MDARYGNVGFGEDTASVAVTISRGQFASLDEAGALLVKGQFKCELTGNTPLFDKPLAATVTSGTLKVGRDDLSIRLSVPIDSIDRGEFSALAKTTGTVELDRIGDAGEDAAAKEEGHE